MSVYSFTVDVQCIRPDWVSIPTLISSYKEDVHYRLYFDTELLTERTWEWANDTTIREEIVVDITGFKQHVIKLEPLMRNVTLGKFNLSNLLPAPELLISNDPTNIKVSNLTYVNDHTITFIAQ